MCPDRAAISSRRRFPLGVREPFDLDDGLVGQVVVVLDWCGDAARADGDRADASGSGVRATPGQQGLVE
jgi:hypothetical protein